MDMLLVKKGAKFFNCRSLSLLRTVIHTEECVISEPSYLMEAIPLCDMIQSYTSILRQCTTIYVTNVTLFALGYMFRLLKQPSPGQFYNGVVPYCVAPNMGSHIVYI